MLGICENKSCKNVCCFISTVQIRIRENLCFFFKRQWPGVELLFSCQELSPLCIGISVFFEILSDILIVGYILHMPVDENHVSLLFVGWNIAINLGLSPSRTPRQPVHQPLVFGS